MNFKQLRDTVAYCKANGFTDDYEILIGKELDGENIKCYRIEASAISHEEKSIMLFINKKCFDEIEAPEMVME